MTYDVLVIDPPWPQKKILRKVRPNQKLELDYPTMQIPDIFALLDREIFSQASTQHVVFMWTIDKFLTETDCEMLQRGYRRHTRIIWDKTNGVAPNMTVRFSHEYLVWYYKPTMTRIDVTQRGKFTTVIRERGREHSRKPDAAYAMINALYPTQTKIDVFSREKRDGWAQWGNETNKFCDTAIARGLNVSVPDVISRLSR